METLYVRIDGSGTLRGSVMETGGMSGRWLLLLRKRNKEVVNQLWQSPLISCPLLLGPVAITCPEI